MVEEYRYTKVESYGVVPPEKSKPIWGNEITEDDIVASIDFQLSLQKLSKLEREIIQLFNQGYTVREIADRMDVNFVYIHRIKTRAVQKMKEMIA